ncbi:Zinc finger, CCHC-type, partial [Sesbania bispinosa]
MDSIEDSTRNDTQSEKRDNDPRIVIFDDDDVQEGLQECENSAIGKIVTGKAIHVNSLTNALNSIWSAPKGFKVVEIGEKIFQIFFREEKDMERVVNGSPWTKKMGWKIGESMGRVIDAIIFEILGKGNFVKVLVEIDINNPLLMGVNAGSRKDEVFWVDFQFEKLPQFCYCCGRIGHDEDNCSIKNTEENDERKFGPWLKAFQSGRRIRPKSEDGRNKKPERDADHELKMKQLATDLFEKLSMLDLGNTNTQGDQKEVGGEQVVTDNEVAFSDKVPITPSLADASICLQSQPNKDTDNQPPTKVLEDCSNLIDTNSRGDKRWKRMRGDTRNYDDKENSPLEHPGIKRKDLMEIDSGD